MVKVHEVLKESERTGVSKVTSRKEILAAFEEQFSFNDMNLNTKKAMRQTY